MFPLTVTLFFLLKSSKKAEMDGWTDRWSSLFVAPESFHINPFTLAYQMCTPNCFLHIQLKLVLINYSYSDFNQIQCISAFLPYICMYFLPPNTLLWQLNILLICSSIFLPDSFPVFTTASSVFTPSLSFVQEACWGMESAWHHSESILKVPGLFCGNLTFCLSVQHTVCKMIREKLKFP